jgi:riboflavin synthase
VGKLTQSHAHTGGRELQFAAAPSFFADSRQGESIAVNGVCLTVSARETEYFSAFASNETLRATNLGGLKPNATVHLERALALSDRLNGHFVTGHVDGTARVLRIQKNSDTLCITLRLPRAFLPLVAVKGSLAVDGVSLTVQGLESDLASFVIIPESVQRTTLGEWRAGREVNIELDVLARYAARWLEAHPPGDLVMEQYAGIRKED